MYLFSGSVYIILSFRDTPNSWLCVNGVCFITGESNVYTLGNIGAHRIVCTKLPTVGHTREAMTAAGNTTTRLLGMYLYSPTRKPGGGLGGNRQGNPRIYLSLEAKVGKIMYSDAIAMIYI